MSNQKEHNSINWKNLGKLFAGLAVIALFYLVFVLIWETQLPGVRLHPALKPLTSTVMRLAGIPALLTYLIWFVVLWVSRPSSNTAYKPILWTCVVLVLTAVLQLVLSMVFGVMGVMATMMALCTLCLTAASAAGFFWLRP